MKKKLLLLFLFFPVWLFSQDLGSIEGHIRGIENTFIKISGFYGNETGVIDSVQADADGNFTYRLAGDAYHGMYRLRFGAKQYIDIICTGGHVRFSSVLDALIDSLQFTASPQNQVYFEYLNRRNLTDYKSELLGPLLAYYPKEDTFYREVTTKYNGMHAGLDAFVDETVERHPGQFVTALIRMDYVPSPPAEVNEQSRMAFLRAHFFDGADFTDTTLLYSNVISNKLLQYLSLYQNNRLSKDQLQVEFIKAVKVIMDRTSVNPLIYEYAMDYLIDGFQAYGFEKVITYIADNIDLDQTCVNSERKAELEKKVESFKKFAVGQKAPDFSATDLNGKEMTLSGIGSEYVLLVFWATWCPHCQQLMPKLDQLNLPGNRDKLQIVAVSLDDSKQELDDFLQKGNYDWINIADFKKWQGPVVQLYDIYATPTMFLLYRDRTILAKPMTFDEVKDALFERNILR